MKLTKNRIYLGIFFLLIVGSYAYFSYIHTIYTKITSFDSCVSAGFTVLSTYPEVCTVPGKRFINEKQHADETTTTPSKVTITDVYKDLQYFIDGQKIEFKSGIGLIPKDPILKKATTTMMMASTTLLDEDINNDHKPDLVFFTIGTSETNNKKDYYLSSALTLNNGFVGSNALYIDSGIASSTISYSNGVLTLTYRDATLHMRTRHYILEDTILKETK